MKTDWFYFENITKEALINTSSFVKNGKYQTFNIKSYNHSNFDRKKIWSHNHSLFGSL